MEFACWLVIVAMINFAPPLFVRISGPACSSSAYATRIIGNGLMIAWIVATLIGAAASWRRSIGRGAGVVVVSVLGMLAALTLIGRSTHEPRWGRALADIHGMGQAVRIYEQHTGRLPETLEDLTKQAYNANGILAGPFLHDLPRTPSGWTPYRYVVQKDGRFRITTCSPEDQPAGPQQVDSVTGLGCGCFLRATEER
jgi:Type II secretion system (T2SS), protein G